MRHEVNTVELPTGVTLDYAEQGDPSGVPVLLLPGALDSWRSFELVLPHLPDSIHAFAIRPRGHGDSSKPHSGYRLRHFADDGSAFMDSANLETAVLVSHSFGTVVAQQFAIDHPGRTLALLLVGAHYATGDHPVDREFYESTVSKLKDPIDPNLVGELQETAHYRPLPESFSETVVQEAMKTPARVWKALWQGFLADDLSDDVHRISAPTLLIWGEEDPEGHTPRSDQDALLAAIPGSRLVVYEGVGHSPHWEVPERLASDLVSFVETIVD